MGMGEIVSGCATGFVALLLAIYVSFTVRQKGPILSNSYLWLSKAQRETVDRKAEYRLVSIVFGGLCGAFACLSIRIFTKASWAMWAFGALLVFVIVYAVVDACKTLTKS